jgi:hypothetical protein
MNDSLAMWTTLRRAWAEIALSARENGACHAAAHAVQELIQCELECATLERRLALARAHDDTGVPQCRDARPRTSRARAADVQDGAR